jgi:thiamine kinase-like enzyme
MNKDQIKIKLQALPFFDGDIHLKFIEGFMTNDCYIVSDDSNRYVVKIGGDKEHYGVVRSHEIEASKAGYKAGIPPKVFYFDDRILVFQYIRSNHLIPEKIKEKKTLKKIIHLMKIVHKEIVNYLGGQNLSNDVFQMINKKIYHLKEKNSPYIDKINNFIKDCEIFEKEFESYEKIFTHNDFFYKNILDDDKKLWLIDWEFSGFNPSYFDLANLSKNNQLSEDDDNFILEEYYGDSITSDSKYKFHTLKCASLLNEVLWSMIAEIFSKKVFDYVSYTAKMLEKYDRQYDYYKSLRI